MTADDVVRALDGEVVPRVPGLQYVVVDADGARFEYRGGFADLRNRIAMSLETTMMGYSMTKTWTAVATLQLVERGQLDLDGEVDRYLPNQAYSGRGVTLRQMLAHTSGAPSPIPLRWVHLAREDASFDEDAALAEVLRRHPNLAFEPGERFLYSNSNIGYWPLGKIIERVSGQSYRDYVRTNVFFPLQLSPEDIGFTIPDASRHAQGYLAKYSILNLLKAFLTDRKLWGGYEGPWLRFESHYLDGPAFGGLIGTARGFARFLTDQLGERSALIAPETRRLLQTRQVVRSGKPIPMSLGWHIGETNGLSYLFKEGGGGGFHSEMRLYPTKGFGSVVMANDTTFRSTPFLSRFDAAFHRGDSR